MARVVDHVLSENQRVLKAENLFNQLQQTKPGSLSSKLIIHKIGDLLNACARSSVDNMAVPTGIHRLPSFDSFLDQIRISGAIGARNMGGGFTPTMLALVPQNSLRHFSAILSKKLSLLCPEINFLITPISIGSPSHLLSLAL
jgi:galactokinase